MAINTSTLSHDDIIDVRDIIERIEELEELIEADEINEDTASGARLNDDGGVFEDICTCGTCGKSWNDALVSGRTPAPAGRCPYEHIHEEIEELKTLTALREALQSNSSDALN